MRINAQRTFWGVQKKSVRELVAYLNQKNNQNISSSKHKLVKMKSENTWLKEQLELLYESDLNTFSPEQKAVFNERLTKIEKSILPTKQTNDFMPDLKKTLFGLHSGKVKANIKQLKTYQDEEMQEIQEQLDRMIKQQNALLDDLKLYSEKFEKEKIAKQSPSEEQRAEPLQDQKVQGEAAKQSAKQSTKRSAKQSAELDVQPTLQTAADQRVQQEQHEQPDQGGQGVQQKQHNQHVPLQNLALINQQVPVSANKPKRLTKEMSSFWEEDVEFYLAGSGTDSMIESEQSIHSHSSDTSQRAVAEMGRARHNIVLDQPLGDRNARKSPAISDQGAYLRRKYIVGKMVGKDLKDDRGKLIARQDTEITEQVLTSAEQAGKLAELIVDMKLQRLGD